MVFLRVFIFIKNVCGCANVDFGEFRHCLCRQHFDACGFITFNSVSVYIFSGSCSFCGRKGSWQKEGDTTEAESACEATAASTTEANSCE